MPTNEWLEVRERYRQHRHGVVLRQQIVVAEAEIREVEAQSRSRLAGISSPKS
jgi:hypothetical protein